MTEAKSRLAKWLQDHPDDWLTHSFASIGKIAGVSATSVDRYLPELIADRDGIMPSKVMRQREDAGLGSPGRSRADTDKIRKCIEEYPDADIRDIAYLAKCTPKAVKRVMEEIEQELVENQNSDKKSESDGDSESEMAQLDAEYEARKAALLKK